MARSSTSRVLILVLIIGALAFAGGLWFGQARERLREFDEKAHASVPGTDHNNHHNKKMVGVEVVPGTEGRLKLDSEVIESLNVRVAVVRSAPLTEPLVLTGSLFLDSSHLAVVHTRFPGE